ncbi:MAG: hypothetical protein JSW71_06290 [Gemmatimonadota bacterium]|nr:MAG: hypothetical protein JSW71_06290 [Gemmatimonadota bacterium]
MAKRRRYQLVLVAGLVTVSLLLFLHFEEAQGWGGGGPTARVWGFCKNKGSELGTYPCCAGDRNGKYYSGTCAAVRGHFASSSGLKEIALWAGTYGSSVRRYHREWTSNYPTYYPGEFVCPPLSVPFSTTQWQNGSGLELKAKLWTPGGSTASDTDTSHVIRNRGYSLYHPGLTTTSSRATYADSAFATAKHTAWGPYGNHDKWTVLANLPYRQAFFIATHSSYSSFQACDSRSISASEVSDELEKRSNQDPGFSFVFIDGCNSATYWNLKNGFANGTLLSYLGWSGDTWDENPHKDWVWKLFEELKDQYTLGQARTAATAYVPKYNFSRQPSGHAGYRLHKTYSSV